MSTSSRSIQRLPLIPDSFVVPDTIQTIFYLCYGVCLYLVPGLLSWKISCTTWPLLLKISLIAITTIIAGHGLFMLGATGHEGFHFTLHRNRLASAVIGIIFSAALPLFCAVGFFINHWHHHRYTNTKDDPDCASLQPFKSPLARLLCTRLHVNRKYLRTTLAIAFAPAPANSALGLPGVQLKRLAIFNLVIQCLWLSAYAILIYLFPQPMLFIAGLPILVAIAISGLNPYQEHAGTGMQTWDQARSRVSFLHTLLMLGTNYHLAHHLYPRVPCWRLPRLHQWLAQQGHFFGKNTFTESQFLRSYRAVGLPYEFGNTVSENR